MTSKEEFSKSAKQRRPPATTAKGREDQMIALAFDQAERQLILGEAPAQVLIHYLKLATTREKLEQEKLALEKDLLAARRDSIVATGDSSEKAKEALRAFRGYQGEDLDDDEYD